MRTSLPRQSLLVARARRVLAELDRARHELARLTGLSGGTLRLGTFQTAGIQLLPPVLSAFRRAYPDVELSVAFHDPPDGITAVAAGEVDLALTHAYEPASLPATLSAEPLLTEELVLVTPRACPRGRLDAAAAGGARR